MGNNLEVSAGGVARGAEEREVDIDAAQDAAVLFEFHAAGVVALWFHTDE